MSGVTRQAEQALRRVLERERDRLQLQLHDLADQVRMLGEGQSEECGVGGDLAEPASDLAQEELDFTLAAMEQARLAQVEAALQRVTLHSYGTCARCGRGIGLARLRAVPWTRFCRACVARADVAVYYPVAS